MLRPGAETMPRRKAGSGGGAGAAAAAAAAGDGLKAGVNARQRTAVAPGIGRKVDKKKKKKFAVMLKAFVYHFLPAWCQPKKRDKRAKRPDTQWEKVKKARDSFPARLTRCAAALRLL